MSTTELGPPKDFERNQKIGNSARWVLDRFADLFTRFGVLLVLVVAVLLACVVYPGFLAGDNVKALLSQSTPDGLVALGMTFVIIAGGFDLSAGSILALCAIVYATAANHMGLAPAAAIAIGVGIVAGAINGLLIARFRINPFIATLGTGSVFGGLAFIYAHSVPVSVTRPSFATLGNDSWFGVPIDVWLLAVMAVLSGLILMKTKFGRSVYAVGGNAEASRLCGIRVGGITATTYMMTGVVAALGGMIIASRLSIVEADIGANTSLDAISIVVIGGTSLHGGEGAIWRTVAGMLILATLTNVLNAKAVDANWQDVVKGGVLIAAVGMDLLVRRYGNRQTA